MILLNLLQTYSCAETVLSGKIVKRERDVVALNIGHDVGVKLGMVFSVYEIEENIILPLSKGKTLISSNKIIGEIQITKVQNSASSGRILLEENSYMIKPMCFVQEYEKPPVPNKPPIIKSIKMKPVNAVQPGKVIEVEVDAIDINSDELIYSWETDRGYFLSSNTLLSVNHLVTPFEKGDFTIKVNVNDQRGGHDQKKSVITVNQPDWIDDLGNYSAVRTLRNIPSVGSRLHVTDVGFDNNNNMYLLDTDGSCVRVFDSNGKYLRTLCSRKLISPNELQIKDDKIYVIYDKNKLLKSYDLNGNLRVNYSKAEVTKRDIGRIINPIALDVSDEGILYVIDGAGPNIAVFEKDGRFRLRFGNSGNKKEQLIDPVAIKIDKGGYIYVLDSDKQEIMVYSPKMQYDRTIKLNKGKYKDMFLDKITDHFYLVNALNEKVHVIDYDGKAIEAFGALKSPYKIAMDKYNNVYVTNNIEGYVSKFNNDDYSYYGKFGTDPFVDITDIAVDKNSSLFLLKEQNCEIVKVDKDGWELSKFGSKGYGDRDFRKPVAIVTGKGGEYVYVLDATRDEIFKFSNSGIFLGIVVVKKNGRVKNIIDIDSDSEGNIYVLDSKYDVCFVYSQDGKFIMQIGTKGKKKEFKRLYKPTRIAVEPDGKAVYVFDDNPKFRKINKYIKKNSKYNYMRHTKYSKGISLAKVNNYKRLIVVDTDINTNHHVISIFREHGDLERTLGEKNSLIKAKDIEVDGVENVYVLSNESKVYIFKQEKLWLAK